MRRKSPAGLWRKGVLYDKAALLYDRAFPSIDLRRREYDWFLAQARPGPGDVLVDIGCGNGRLLEAAAPLVKKAIGVDPSAAMAGLARRNLARFRNVTVKRAPGEKTGLPSACADIVVSFFSFRYLEQAAGLREMLRLLRLGGRLIVIDMFREERPALHPAAILAAKARTHALILSRPGARRALRELVRGQSYRQMVSSCPLRGLDDFQRLIRSRFPLAGFRRLDPGWRAQTIGFHSGPIDLMLRGERPGGPRACVMDWGIGGLGFYKLFKKKYPRVPVLYFSDSGSTPYGRLSARRLRERLRRIIEFLKLNRVTHLVVACNAMSTVLEGFDLGPGINVTGVIRPAAEFLRAAPWRTVGVIGGRRTIGSGAYRRALRGAGKGLVARATQRLSDFVERGDCRSAEFNAYLARALRPFAALPALVLACTHYPAAAAPIRRLVKAELVDPAELALAWVERHWKIPAGSRGPDVFVTTGDAAQTAASARRMFGVTVRGIRKIDI